MRKKTLSYEKKKRRYGYVFIAPWFIGFIFLFLLPMLQSIRYSFSDINLANGLSMKFAGLSYYERAFVKDTEFLPRLGTAMSDMAYQVPLVLVFSLAIAYVLNGKFRGATFFKSVFFLPVIVASGVVITIVQGDAFAQVMNNAEAASSLYRATSITSVLLNMGLSADLVASLEVITGNIFNLTWKSGIQILIFIAAFKSVPVGLYEASTIEGATAWETFWKITFPLISPMILTNLIYTIIDTFTDYSNPVIQYIATNSQKVELSFSAAMSWIYFIIIGVIMAAVYIIVNRKVFYQLD